MYVDDWDYDNTEDGLRDEDYEYTADLDATYTVRDAVAAAGEWSYCYTPPLAEG